MEASTYTQDLERRHERAAKPALQVAIPAGPEAARAARRALAGVRRDLDPELVQKLRLLVSELVTNSVRHSGIEPGSKVGVHLAVFDETVRLTVADNGTGFVPHAREAGPDVPGGWGLVLVERLADRWGVVTQDGSRVWLEIDRRGR